MQVRLGNTSVATETTKPAQGNDKADPHAATAMPGGSSSLLARLRGGGATVHAEASALDRPRAPLRALARAGLGLATLGITAAAVTGCSSGTSGVAVGSSPTPSAPPPSSAQSIDPAPTDSAIASTVTTAPSTAASSPSDIPSVVGQPSINVTQAQTQLDLYAGMEADAITSEPRPTDNILGNLYDSIGTDNSNPNVNYNTLLIDLDLYLTEEEARKNNIPPESAPVQLIRGERMTQNVKYREAIYRQNPTQDNYAEWKAARDAVTEAINDNLIPKHPGDPLPDDLFLPN